MTDIKRPNYFKSQFLQAEDFQAEQAYHRDMRHLLNKHFHDWGVVYGLDVSPGDGKQVSVSSGVALDQEGREIVLSAPFRVDLSDYGDGEEAFIVIEYADVDDEADLYQSVGVLGKYTRTTERPRLVASSTAPDNFNQLVLASVIVSANGITDANINSAVRKIASRLNQPGASVQGSLSVTDNLTVSKSLTVTEKLTVNGALEAHQGLRVRGELVIDGEVTSKTTEQLQGDVELGNEDSDEIRIYGVIQPTHTSGRLQIAKGLDLGGPLSVNGALSITDKLGVGVVTPQDTVDIGGNIRLRGGKIKDASGTSKISITNNDNLTLHQDDGKAALTVSKNGNIGIGDTNPEHKLVVNGGIQSPVLQSTFIRPTIPRSNLADWSQTISSSAKTITERVITPEYPIQATVLFNAFASISSEKAYLIVQIYLNDEIIHRPILNRHLSSNSFGMCSLAGPNPGVPISAIGTLNLSAGEEYKIACRARTTKSGDSATIAGAGMILIFTGS